MNGPSRDRKFSWFLLASLLLHCLLLWVMVLPGRERLSISSPPMIELGELKTEAELAQRQERPVQRQSDQRRRVEQERAPRGERQQVLPGEGRIPAASVPKRPSTGKAEAEMTKTQPSRDRDRAEEAGSSQFRRRPSRSQEMARLLPGADRLASLEEGYRRKYGPEVADSDTAFLNTDDIQFGSFLRRFENAVYGVWRYPADASRLGVEGVTAVRITFNRRGEVERYDILEGSGSRLLDDEVGRTLKGLGRIGGFPSGYDKEHFHLIAFFHYSIVRGAVRGTLR